MLNKLKIEKAEAEKSFFTAVKHLKKFRKKILPVFERDLQDSNTNFTDKIFKLLTEDESLKALVEEKGMTVKDFVSNRKPLYSEAEPSPYSYFVRTFIMERFEIDGIAETIKSIENKKWIIKNEEVLMMTKKSFASNDEFNNMTYEKFKKENEEYKLLETICEIKSEIFELKETEILIYKVIENYRKNTKIFNTNLAKKKNIILDKSIDETMLKITQTAGLSDFLYAIPSVTKHGNIDAYDTSKQVYINESKDIEFTISIPEAFKKNPMLTENHVKLFLFSLHKHCTGDKKRTLIPYKEFFDFKGLDDNKDNRKKLKKEIEELESVEFDYKYKEKGAKEWTKVSKARAISYLDTRPGSGISVAFGTWAEYIPSTFIDINKAVFKYPVTRNSIGATTISFKLRELSSMNKKSVRVRILTDLLDISEKVINKHGFSWVKDKLERELERIEEAEKLQWQYRNGVHNSRIDFENDYIEFRYS
ncbi:hypothetical protein [Bacillus paranthracis]|uniref:hypothetical protein n=1 Tax=Bacillus paranthracis TaxID=2026186 RepID=UPI0021D2A28C|nr:hypothetical protein [Bacillus paranthracis]MCU5214277.1 hypothetical protein [Bacillus paranthracis]